MINNINHINPMHFLKLRGFVKDYIDKIDWMLLSNNSNAIYLLEENLDKINWMDLSENPNAIHLLRTKSR